MHCWTSMENRVELFKLYFYLYFLFFILVRVKSEMSSPQSTVSGNPIRWQFSQQLLLVDPLSTFVIVCLLFVKVLSITFSYHCLPNLNGAQVKASVQALQWQSWQSILPAAKRGNKNTNCQPASKLGGNINSPRVVAVSPSFLRPVSACHDLYLGWQTPFNDGR